MARQTGFSGATVAQTPLQQVTQFFLTADLTTATAAADIASVILATRIAAASAPVEAVSGAGMTATLAELADAVRSHAPAVHGIGADGRVKRGRPRKGLPEASHAHVLAGMAVPAAAPLEDDGPVLPDQGTPEDD